MPRRVVLRVVPRRVVLRVVSSGVSGDVSPGRHSLGFIGGPSTSVPVSSVVDVDLVVDLPRVDLRLLPRVVVRVLPPGVLLISSS